MFERLERLYQREMELADDDEDKRFRLKVTDYCVCGVINMSVTEMYSRSQQESLANAKVSA